jgi:hypothetical protein
MSAKEPKAAGPADPWAEFSRQWLSAYKANLDTLLAVASATLAGAERMRMAQLAADVETQAQNRQAAKDVAASQDVPGVLAAQSQLSGAYSEGYLRCWTAMAEAAQRTQFEIAQILTARAGEINSEMRNTFALGRTDPFARVKESRAPSMLCGEPVLRSVHGCLHAAFELELPEDMLDVDLDGALGDAELTRDLLVGPALRDEREDLLLAWRKW